MPAAPSAAVEHEGFLEAHRSLGIEDDARATLHDQTVAKRLHQTAGLLTRFGGEREGRLRQINHHSVRIGERERDKVDLPIQIDHKAGLLVVSANSHIGRNDRRLRGRGRSTHCHALFGGDGQRRASGEQRADDRAGNVECAGCHESGPFFSPFLAH